MEIIPEEDEPIYIDEDPAEEPVDEYNVDFSTARALKAARTRAPAPATATTTTPTAFDPSAVVYDGEEGDEEEEEEVTMPDEHDITFAEHFAPYFRKPEDMPTPLEFQVNSAECISSKLRADLDDSQADHTPTHPTDSSGPSGQKAWYKKRAMDPVIMVPVIKLYGTTKMGSSVCLDVYGFYPCFRLRVVRGTVRYDTLTRMRAFIEAKVLHTDPAKPRQVISAEFVEGYTASPYTPDSEHFMEFRLAHSRHVMTLAKYFVSNTEWSDGSYGIMVVCPHSADDVLTQFMVTKKIIGCGWVRADALMEPNDYRKKEQEKCPCSFVLDCNSRSVQPIPLVAFDEIAPVRVLTLDIECLKDAGMPDPKKHPVIIIGCEVCNAEQGMMVEKSVKRIVFMWHPSSEIGKVERADLQFNYGDEKSMLVSFGSFVRAYDPDMYLGHNIVGFDIPYLVVRANQLGVPLLAHLGRRCKYTWIAPREIKSQRKNGTQRKSLRTDTPGVIQVDTLPLMQAASKESSYKLGNLAANWLGDTKMDVGYQMINPLWRYSALTRKHLGDYCLKDARLSRYLARHEKLEFILSIINLSRDTCVLAERLLRSGNQEKVRTLVLHQAAEPHFDDRNLPVFFPYEVPKQRAKDDKFEGATVLNPKRGPSTDNLPVAVGDYKSLYPSIQISFNICYTTQLLMPEDKYKGALVPFNLAPDTGAKFVKSTVRKGILPMILEHLLSARDQAKAMKKRSAANPAREKYFDSKQLQLKIIANSTYGGLTTSGGWFVRMLLGESVTSWGRYMISQAKLIAESAPFFAEVVYG